MKARFLLPRRWRDALRPTAAAAATLAPRRSARTWSLEALEPRVLLSADPVLGAVPAALLADAGRMDPLDQAYAPGQEAPLPQNVTLPGDGGVTSPIVQPGYSLPNDSLRVDGDLLIQATAGNITLGSLGHGDKLSGHSSAKADHLTLSAIGNVTINAEVGLGAAGTDLLSSLTVLAAQNVSFKEAVTVAGALTVHASGIVTFDAPVTLRNGGSLTILGAAQIVMKGALALQTTGAGTPGDIVLEGDEIDLFDVGEELITGSGSVTLRPTTVGNAMAILVGAPTANTLNLDPSDLRAFADGFAGFVFGHAAGGHALSNAGPVLLGAGTAPDSLALRDAVRVYGGSITVADFSASSAILRLGAGDGLELDAAGDIAIYNEIEADRITLYSASGSVAALDAGADTRMAEPVRTPSLAVHAAAGISLASLEVGRIDVDNTGTGTIDLGQNAARSTARFPGEIDGGLDIGHLSQAGAGAVGVLARAGDIVLLAGPGIVVAGAGALSLTAQGAGSDIALLAPVALGGGPATFSAADSFSTAAPITSGGASAIVITAGTGSLTLGAAVVTAGGSLTLTSAGVLDLGGVTLDAGPGGAIALQAAGDLRIGVVQAAASIALTSTGGAIVDALAGDAANLRGDAAQVTLAAAGGVGSALAPLRTAVGSLTASVGGASGGIFVVEADDLTVAAGGLATTGSGAIVVRTLAGDLGTAGTVHAQGTGHVLLDAGGSLTVQADVLAQAGSISLLAGQALAVTGSQVRTAGSQQTLDLRAGAGLTLGGTTLLATVNAAQRLQAGGGVVLGAIDAGGGTVTVLAGGAVSAATPSASVVAAALRVQAGGAVGSGAAPLHTQIARLAGGAAGGGLYIAEADDVAVGSVAEQAVFRVDAAGTATALAPAAALAGLTATGGALVLDAGGTVTVDAAVAATGPVRLGAGAALAVGAGVSSTAGQLSLLAGGAISHAAAAALSTAGGAIDEQAGGAIGFAAGATASTGGGRLRLQAGGALTLGLLDAGAGEAWLQGTRIGSAAGGVALVAGDARLVATGTGSADGLGSAADALQLRVQRLALASAGAGGAFVSEADGVTVDDIAARAGSRVQVDGSVAALAADPALGGLASAAGLVLGAGGDLTVRARVDAQRTRLSAGVDLSLQAQLAAGGALTLAAGRDLRLEAGVAGGAGLDVAAGRHLLMASTASATAQDASLLRAGGDMALSAVAVAAGRPLSVEAGGSLRDAGDGGADLSAGRLSLSAGGGIGEPGNALEIAAGQLGATAGAGVFIDADRALAVDRSAGPGSDSVAVQRVAADGTVSALTVAAVHGLGSEGAPLVLRLLAGALSVDADVSSQGGAIRLEAAGGMAIAAPVASAGGALSVIAGGAVQQTVSGGLCSGGGSVDLQAGGAWTMAQGSIVVSAGGALRLATAGELAVARLDAGVGAMSVTAAQVKDVAGDGAEADLVAASLMLRITATAATAGVGSGSDPLEIAAQRLAVDAAGGGVFIAQGGDLVVDALAAFDGRRVQLDGTVAAGGAGDAALAGLRSSAGLVLRGSAGLLLNAVASAAGGVLLASEGDFTVAAALGSSGAISLSAGRDLLLQSAVAGTGAGRSIDLAAVRDIAQAQGAALQTANGAVALRAGRDITLESLDAGTAGVALVAGGAIADGDAAGDTETDVAAGALRITAGGAVGSGANALETAVGTLSVQAASLSLAQGRSMTVDRVATSLQRVAADGSAQTLDLGAQEDLRVDGSLLLTALAGDLTLNGGTASPETAVQAGGPLLLHAQTGSLQVRAAVEAAGPASLRAGGDLAFAPAGDVTLAAAAGLDVEAGGSISMADGTVFTSAGGPLRLSAVLNLSVGALQTGGDVGLTARSITDAGSGETDVAARALGIDTTGTGTTQGFGTASAPLQLQVEVLAAGVAGTGAGGFFARALGALRIDTVSLTATRVSADGSIAALVDAPLSDLVSGGNVVLGTAGGLVLADGGDGDGVAIQSEGNVLLDAAGDIAVDAALRATAGAVSLLAGGGIALNADVGIARTGRTLDLQAGGALTMSAAARLSTVDSAVRVQAGGDLRVAGIAAGLGSVSLISTGGSIVASAGHAGAEVAAAGLRLNAAVGVGGSDDPLDTAVQRLSARAGGGGIWLREADAVTVTDVSVSVRRVGSQGTTGTSVDDAPQSDLVTTGGNGSIALATLDGSIVLADGGAPQDGRSVRAHGSGTVSLTAGGTGATVGLPAGGAIEQQGAVGIDGGLKLDGAMIVTAGLGGARGDGTVTISGAVEGTAGGASDALFVTSDGADVVFGGTVGAVERLGGLTVDDARNVRFDRDVKLAGDLTLHATGRVEFKGALDLASGNLQVIGASELVLGNVVLTAGDAVIRVDALTLAGLVAGGAAARLDLAGAMASSGVTVGAGTAAGLTLGTSQLAAMRGFSRVQIGQTGQGPTAVNVAVLGALATPQIVLAGATLSVQGGSAAAAVLGAGVQKLELAAAQDLAWAGTVGLAAPGASVQATAGGALRMAVGAEIAAPAGDVRLQAAGDLRVGRIDTRGTGGVAGPVWLTSVVGSVAEAGGDAVTDVFADRLTLRGRGPALVGGASEAAAALDVQARVVEVDAPTGVVARDSAADGRTMFNLIDGGSVYQELVAAGAPVRQVGAADTAAGAQALGWAWLNAVRPLEASRDTTLAAQAALAAPLPARGPSPDAVFALDPAPLPASRLSAGPPPPDAAALPAADVRPAGERFRVWSEELVL